MLCTQVMNGISSALTALPFTPGREFDIVLISFDPRDTPAAAAEKKRKHLEYWSSAEWAEAVKKYIIPFALEGLDLGDDVLELGPGPGRTTEILKDMAPKLTAVELDKDLAGPERTHGGRECGGRERRCHGPAVP
jgi:hypothetical protein